MKNQTIIYNYETLFLHSLSYALRGDIISPDISAESTAFYIQSDETSDNLLKNCDKVLKLSNRHLMLPMIYEVLYRAMRKWFQTKDFFEKEDAYNRVLKWEQKALQQVACQFECTAAFLDLYEYLLNQGVRPLVVKGIVCRQTYPIPEYRQSWDEDLLVRQEEFSSCHQALLKYGMQVESSKHEVEQSYEVIYRDLTSGLVIEIHKSLFPEDSEAYGDLNRYFKDVFEQAVPLTIEEDTVWTMDPDLHFFYLICHTFKHFLHFGTGMRQLTDILMYAKCYGEVIHWNDVWTRCKDIRANRFVASIFAIGEKYLGFNFEDTEIPRDWVDQAVDIDSLLRDVLDAGMQANTSMSRIHSSSITLDAVVSQKEGKETERSIWRKLFLPYRPMSLRYPYLNKLPFLLPFAWGQRIFHYGFETMGKGEKNSTEEALRIGKERVELLRIQGILDEPSDSEAKKASEKPNRFSLILRIWSHIKIFSKKDTNQIDNKHKDQKQKDRIRINDSRNNEFHSKFSGFLKEVGNTSLGGRAIPFASTLWKGVFCVQWCILRFVWFLDGYRMPGPKEQDTVRKNVTFIYKSFERKDMAIGLYKNIQKFYPGVQVIIADDSKGPLDYSAPYLRIIHLPFNSGLSRGISTALQEVRTPYVMRMDDDELLTRRTNIGKQLLFLAQHPEVDIVTFGFITIMNHHPEKSVWPVYYKTTMSDAPKKLKIRHMTRLDDSHVVFGKGPNIYLARTDSIRKVGYDENIRMIDHHEFFYRAAGVLVTVGAIDSFVFHKHNPFDKEYQKYRGDIRSDQEYLSRKYKTGDIIKEGR